MQMKTIFHEKAARLFLLQAFFVLAISTVTNAEVIERFPDGKPKIVETVTASTPYRYENHIQYMEHTGQPCHMLKKTYKNDRLFSISEAGGNCLYRPDFGLSFVDIEKETVVTRYNEWGRIISKTGPGWEKQYDDNGNLVYEKGLGYEKKCNSNGNCEVTKETRGYTSTLSCNGNNCSVKNIKVEGRIVCSGNDDCREYLAKEDQKRAEKRKAEQEKREKEKEAMEAQKEKQKNKNCKEGWWGKLCTGGDSEMNDDRTTKNCKKNKWGMEICH